MLFFLIIGQLSIETMLIYFSMLWVVQMRMKYLKFAIKIYKHDFQSI
jgi:hypothetical protein